MNSLGEKIAWGADGPENFIKMKSSENILLDFFRKLSMNKFDGQEVACGIFIDLEKAFDTVDHILLLKKLAHY